VLEWDRAGDGRADMGDLMEERGMEGTGWC